MNIEIVNLQSVRANGIIYGNFSEACVALPTELVNLQSALVLYMQGGEDSRAQVAALQQELAAAKALYLAGDTAGLAALIADSEKTDKQKQAETLQAQIATAQAQLDALNN